MFNDSQPLYMHFQTSFIVIFISFPSNHSLLFHFSSSIFHLKLFILFFAEQK